MKVSIQNIYHRDYQPSWSVTLTENTSGIKELDNLAGYGNSIENAYNDLIVRIILLIEKINRDLEMGLKTD